LLARRRLLNRLALAASLAAMLIGLIALGAILSTLAGRGFSGWAWTLFAQDTPPPGSAGGLRNAIVGSLLMTGLATLIGTPVGVLAGTYLSEFGDRSRLAGLIRFVNGILLSAPSIVIGFFVYTAYVLQVGRFSGWGGVLALAIILLPVVVSSTENVLRLVPKSLREAAIALGTPEWKVTLFILYRAARPGMLTGILLAVARICGESAPLLFTALNNQFWSMDLARPLANLPVTIFQYASSPYEDWRDLAWAGALLITFAVLALNVAARVFFRKRGQSS
jgi:phosphate transport system permease protein